MKTLQTCPGEGLERATVDAARIDKDRRLWITATTVAGGTGLVASAVPFVASLAPSERARAMGAPVAVELQAIRFNPSRPAALRSVAPGMVVLEAVCTHLGCIPSFRPTLGAPDIGASWPGGFYCPCHGSKFDFAGRVFKNVPAPTNLTVPPHEFTPDSKLLIGSEAKT